MQNMLLISFRSMSLPPRGAWIEIQWHLAETYDKPRRSPRGERGLKFSVVLVLPKLLPCRSPRGERGLKCDEIPMTNGVFGRSPRGERGLK